MVSIVPGRAIAPAPESIRDPRQRWACLRGITTSVSRHVKAGKQERVGDHLAPLRSLFEECPITHY
jgi:hypothetical protein